MNTRHESFLSRYGSPRELKWLVSIDTASTQQVSSRVAPTYAILNLAQQCFRFEDDQNTTQIWKIHTLTEKIITGVKFTLNSHDA